MPSHSDQFEQLMHPHLDRLYRLAYRLAGTVADAEDLLQDVLIKLYSQRQELTSIENLSPWLGRVLYNQFIDQQRKYSRQRVHLVAPRDSQTAEHHPLESAASPLPGPEIAVDQASDITRLGTALAQLSEDHRLVVMLHDAEGYTLDEVNKITGVALGTLKSRLHRARARLRDLLEDGTF